MTDATTPIDPAAQPAPLAPTVDDDPVAEMSEVIHAMRTTGDHDPALEAALHGAAVAHARFLARIYGTAAP